MTVTAPNLPHLWASALVDELVRGGVQHAVLSPGSRSTPLAWACLRQSGLRLWDVVDERTAGFFALGVGKASGRPAAVITTSGSAGAHLLPAVMEARLSGVPMVVLTADRPTVLHGFGANQSVDQNHLFGRWPVAFVDLGEPQASASALLHLRHVAARAAGQAAAGPVHLNVPLDEPLAPTPQTLPPLPVLATSGRGNGVPMLRHFAASMVPAPNGVTWVDELLRRSKRPCVVVGADDGQPDVADAVASLAARLGVPVVADPASVMRQAPDPAHVIWHADAVLAAAGSNALLVPDLVLRMGGRIASRALQSFVDACTGEVVLISGGGEPMDPNHSGSTLLQGALAATCAALSGTGPLPEARPYLHRWLACQQRMSAWLGALDAPNMPLTEANTARTVVQAMPSGGALWVASSMPIRDVATYAAAPRGVLRLLASRGAAGIDGMVASAFGARATLSVPTVALVGDTAFLHDVGSLMWGARLGLDLVVVVINNGGGRIFERLPVGAFDVVERLCVMPHRIRLAHAASLAGATHHEVNTISALQQTLAETLAMGGVHVVEVPVEPGAAVRQHAANMEEAAAALGALP